MDGSQADNGATSDELPVRDARYHWLHGPWRDAQEFLSLALRAIHDYSFGNKGWYGAANPGWTEAAREKVGEYRIIRNEGRRPFPVVISDVESFAERDLPTDYPDTLVLLYSDDGLKQYLGEHKIRDELLIVYLGQYNDGWIPQTYVSFYLIWVRLDPDTGQLIKRGDFSHLYGWVIGRMWEGKYVTKIQIESMGKS